MKLQFANMICLCVLLLILMVDCVPARVIIDPGVDAAGNSPYGRLVQGRQVTALITVTRRVPSVLTLTVSTSLYCMKLSTSGSLTPSTQCAKKRDLRIGHQDEEPMLYILYGEDGEDIEFVRANQIHPTKVHRVEATELVQFQDGTPAEPVIESSVETGDSRVSNGVRVAQPVYFAALASLLSKVFSSAIEITTTSTMTSTVYKGGTKFVTTYTSTNSIVLLGSCYPAFPSLCPL